MVVYFPFAQQDTMSRPNTLTLILWSLEGIVHKKTSGWKQFYHYFDKVLKVVQGPFNLVLKGTDNHNSSRKCVSFERNL